MSLKKLIKKRILRLQSHSSIPALIKHSYMTTHSIMVVRKRNYWSNNLYM